MAVLATDNFTRGNSATLGGLWATAKGVSESLGILTNQAEFITAGNTEGNYYSGVTAPNDQYSKAVAATLLNYWQGVTVRSITSGTTRNAYVAGLDVGDFGGSATLSRVWKEIANVTTSLGTGATVLATGQTWEHDAQGTGLKMFINGVQEISVSDGALTAGQFGIQGFATGAGGIGIFSNWEGGDFLSGAIQLDEDAEWTMIVQAA